MTSPESFEEQERIEAYFETKALKSLRAITQWQTVMAEAWRDGPDAGRSHAWWEAGGPGGLKCCMDCGASASDKFDCLGHLPVGVIKSRLLDARARAAELEADEYPVHNPLRADSGTNSARKPGNEHPEGPYGAHRGAPSETEPAPSHSERVRGAVGDYLERSRPTRRSVQMIVKRAAVRSVRTCANGEPIVMRGRPATPCHETSVGSFVECYAAPIRALKGERPQ